MKKAIGIDLGTSHSSAAHVDGGFPMMIEISEEGYSIPSVVSFDEKGQQSKMVCTTYEIVKECSGDHFLTLRNRLFWINLSKYSPMT